MGLKQEIKKMATKPKITNKMDSSWNIATHNVYKKPIFEAVLTALEKKIVALGARSGWEMLPAIIFTSPKRRKIYYQGAKDMEAVWKEIIKESLDSPPKKWRNTPIGRSDNP